jgi:hypothetical protein
MAMASHGARLGRKNCFVGTYSIPAPRAARQLQEKIARRPTNLQPALDGRHVAFPNLKVILGTCRRLQLEGNRLRLLLDAAAAAAMVLLFSPFSSAAKDSLSHVEPNMFAVDC